MKNNLYSITVIAIVMAVMAVTGILSSCVMDFRPRTEDFFDSEEWGKVVIKEINLEPFTEIAVSGHATVIFEQSDSFQVILKGNENAFDAYNIMSVKSDPHSGDFSTLRIEDDLKIFKQYTPAIHVYVYAPKINNIVVAGEGDVKMKGDINIEDLSVSMTGTGDLNIKNLTCINFSSYIRDASDLTIDKLKAEKFTTKIKGAGDVKLSKAEIKESATIECTGAGDAEGDIKANVISASTTGAGDIDLKVDCNSLTLISTGAGDIEVKGKTGVLTKRRQGLGGIKTRHLKAEKVELQKGS